MKTVAVATLSGALALLGLAVVDAAALAQGEVVFGGLKLPEPGFAKKIENSIVEEFETEGLQVKIGVIPDLFAYKMAKGLEELHKTGHSGRKLEDEIKTLYSAAKRSKGMAAFRVHLGGGASDCHYFIQSKLEKHLVVSGGARVGGKLTDLKPRYSFAIWTLIQGASTKKRSLMRYDELEFVRPVKLKKGDKPIELEFKDFVRYQEVPKKSDYEYRGINLDVKQIALGDFRDLQHPTFGKKFYPGKWKLPKAPKGFDELIAHLEGGK